MERTREEIFAVLVREHELGLAAFVRACVHDPAAADYLVQETFVTAWQQLETYDQGRPFAGWLRGIARNKLAHHRERCAAESRRIHTLQPDAVAELADEFDRLNRPVRGEVYRDCFAALAACLEQALSSRDREVVQRAYRDEQPCRVIAGHIGQTVEAVKKRLQRARAALRDCIERRLATETDDA